MFFFFNDTATPEIYTLSLHDALPIFGHEPRGRQARPVEVAAGQPGAGEVQLAERTRRHRPQPVVEHVEPHVVQRGADRSEEHTSELQSRQYLVCRLLLEKKKKKRIVS